MGCMLNMCCSDQNQNVGVNPSSSNTSTSKQIMTEQSTTHRSIDVKRTLTHKDIKGFKTLDESIKNRYRFFQTLGKGSFGEVRKAEHIKGGYQCAIKIVKKAAIQKHQILVELMHNELKILESTTHPNIMKIYELLEDDSNYYIVAELLEGGELYDRVVQLKLFKEKDAAILVNQILLALTYMHSKQMIHRDIKPENILLESDDLTNLNIKMTDFGFACFFDPEKGLSDVLGSPLYMAPEIVQEQQYDQKVDIWSVGVITYILLSGRPPFKGRQKPEIFQSIINDDPTFINPVWDKISNDAKNFIKLALQKDHSKRATSSELINHSWIKKCIEQKELDKSIQLDIAKNLKEFKDTTAFQNGVLSFIVSMKATTQDLDKLKEVFLALDTSKDGTLQKEELQQGLTKLNEVFQGDIDYSDLMEACDQNGDGVIDYTEFINAAIDKAIVLKKENLVAAFQLIDKDNSGMITIDELKSAFDSHGEKDESLWRDIMNEVDKNNDNEISLEEFMSGMQSLLKKKHSYKK